MRKWSLTPQNLFLALGKGGKEYACTLEGLMHVAHDAPTGQGKTEQWKAEIIQLLKLGIQVILCNPHFALNQISNRQLVKPFPFTLPVIGMNREATEAIIDRALALPKDVPLSTLPADKTTFVLPIKDKLSLLVVKLVEQNPLTRELYNQLVQAGGVQSLMANQDDVVDLTTLTQATKDNVIADAFGFDAMAKRNNFVERTGEGAPVRHTGSPIDSDM